MSTYDAMIGKSCPEGPGGRNCPCCGQAPGTERARARRRAKHAERQTVKRFIRDEQED